VKTSDYLIIGGIAVVGIVGYFVYTSFSNSPLGQAAQTLGDIGQGVSTFEKDVVTTTDTIIKTISGGASTIAKGFSPPPGTAGGNPISDLVSNVTGIVKTRAPHPAVVGTGHGITFVVKKPAPNLVTQAGNAWKSFVSSWGKVL
jgi:hypothetical protein